MDAMTSDTLWNDAPGPCIGVCEYAKPRRDGTRRCKGCAMTRPEKRGWNTMDAAARRPWIETLVRRLSKKPKRLARWRKRYRAKCVKRGVDCPLDAMEPARPNG